jgi:hypothetical protein
MHMTHRDANVLSRAAVLLGGVPVLAQRLNVRPEELLTWIANKATTPEAVAASASAIVNAYEIDLTGTRLIKVNAVATQRKRASPAEPTRD